MDRPILCANCGNWHIKVPMPEGQEECPQCLTNRHTANKAGVIDCHYGMQSATYSEIEICKSLQQIELALEFGQKALATIPTVPSREAVDALSAKFSELQDKAKERFTKIDNDLRWAGVFEFPGKADPNLYTSEERFQDISAIQNLVVAGRRPQSDIIQLRRSIKVCGEMATEANDKMDRVRDIAAEIKFAASNWKQPVKAEPEPEVYQAKPKSPRPARRRKPAPKVAEPAPATA